MLFAIEQALREKLEELLIIYPGGPCGRVATAGQFIAGCEQRS